ncbi:hypothetical protein C8Q73DRAFT_630401, partial [Cubamyces lactineus]
TQTPVGTYITAPIQCCQYVEPASGAIAANRSKSACVAMQDFTTSIGITCSSINVVCLGDSD